MVNLADIISLEQIFRDAADYLSREMSREANDYFRDHAAREYKITTIDYDEDGNEYETPLIIDVEQEIRQGVRVVREAHGRAAAIADKLSREDREALFHVLYDLMNGAFDLGKAPFGTHFNLRQHMNGKEGKRRDRAFEALVEESLRLHPTFSAKQHWHYVNERGGRVYMKVSSFGVFLTKFRKKISEAGLAKQ
jgi:hypothetical protein